MGEIFERRRAASAPYIGRPPRTADRSTETATEGDESSCNAGQVHVSLGDSLDSAVVSFASPDFNSLSRVEYSDSVDALLLGDLPGLVQSAVGNYRTYSELLYTIPNLENPVMGAPTATTKEVVDMLSTADWAFDHKTGQHYSNWYNVTEISYGFGQYNNPDFYYHSPLLHKVVLSGLSPATTYFYRVSGSCEIFNFTMPPFHYNSSTDYPGEFYPFSMGLTGDVGLTEVSMKSLAALQALKPDVVLLVGDLSYADGWQYSWDTWGDVAQDLAAHVPLMTTNGNHETGFGENNVPYYLRYSTPYTSSLSPDPGYWGREIGPVHVVAINSYAGFAVGSIQYDWLDMYLSTRINRDRTPWLVVMMHTPWYNSNDGHWMEGEKLRANMEPLFNKYGVDLSISGHVHSYERTAPVFNFTRDACGTTYMNMGDGGNYEGYSGAWRMPAPDWAEFREASFGVGELIVANETHAYFSWHRHACQSDDPDTYNMNFSSSCSTTGDNSDQAMETSDEVWIVRPSLDQCPNHHVGSQYEPVNPATVNTENDDADNNGDGPLSRTSIVLIAVGSALMLANVVMVALYYTATNKTRRRPNMVADLSDHSSSTAKRGPSVGGDSADAKYEEYRRNPMVASEGLS